MAANFDRLQKLLESPIPKFKQIEEEFSVVPPALLSVEILKDPVFAYLVDYYFRFIDEQVVRRIIQNPMFEPKALGELLFCNITSNAKSKMQNAPSKGVFESYFKYADKAQIAILFKALVKRTSSHDLAKEMIQKMDLNHLKMMTKSNTLPKDAVFLFFKKLGKDLHTLVTHDMNYYDFVFDLASNVNDQEYLQFLEEYTIVMVQIRVAQTFLHQLEELGREKNKKPGLVEIQSMLESIPTDCLELTLDIFKEKGFISEQERENLLHSRSAWKTV